MPNSLKKILIVDDSPSDINALLEHIGDAYQVTAASNGELAISKLNNGYLPDAVLLDVNMPGIDGYETCERIKQDPNLSDVEVIFVSAKDSAEEIIHGIDVGASDYIVKPFEPEIVKLKLRRVIDSHQSRKALIEKADAANKMVHSVLSEAGSMGVVLNFLRDCIKVKSCEQLVNYAVSALDNLQLDAVVFCKIEELEELSSNRAAPGFLELDLIDRVYKSQQPLFEFDRRLLVARDHTVIYIKNMPTSSEQIGTLKDCLMILIDGINANLETICERRRFEARGQKIANVLQFAKAALIDAATQHSKYKKQGVGILDEMIQTIEDKYFALGLTEEQEAELSKVMQEAVEASCDHLDRGEVLDKEMQAVIDMLSVSNT